MWYTNMYSYIKVCQNYLVTSIKVGCATRNLYASSSPKAKESRLTIRGDGDQDPVNSEEVSTRPVI